MKRPHEGSDSTASGSSGVVLTSRQLEDLLVRGTAFAPLTESRLDYGQVLRACIAIFREVHGEMWPRHVGLLITSQDLQPQMHAPLMLCVLYSRDHWALLACHRQSNQAVFYDGLSNSTCWDHALAMVQLLHDEGWFLCESRPALVQAEVPQQEESWSCGHRVIIVTDVLMDLKGAQRLPLHIGHADLSRDNIRVLCEHARGKVQPSSSEIETSNGDDADATPKTPPPKRRKPAFSSPCGSGHTPHAYLHLIARKLTVLLSAADLCLAYLAHA